MNRRGFIRSIWCAPIAMAAAAAPVLSSDGPSEIDARFRLLNQKVAIQLKGLGDEAIARVAQRRARAAFQDAIAKVNATTITRSAAVTIGVDGACLDDSYTMVAMEHAPDRRAGNL